MKLVQDMINLFDPELQLINIKPLIKNKLKELLNELKKLKAQTVLVTVFYDNFS